ncbi:MCE family protein [Actinophytocola sp.]|uniref:MCE family protein n=1 Tax=Actinophytocola sp. TaxID=1872138 RepID=UPI002D80AC18|nr:MCE family protein [Actinophytocola sp.]HET9138481.1 MCE family protein [Actinophytocola sp.]
MRGLPKLRLLLFAMVAVAGIGYVGGSYVGLFSSGYTVTAQFADSGGIFANAEVTYRGVPVGRVGELRLSDTGIDVLLRIDAGAPPIPADARAVVATRSAIGEQYVDLVPAAGAGPFLGDGSVIPRDRTGLPPTPEGLLSSVDRLVRSVPVDALRTVVTELGAAFGDSGPALAELLDSAGTLTTAATEHLPQTISLLANGRTVLQTQADQSQLIIDYSRDLRLIAEQLSRSDPDLRTLISTVPQVSAQVSGLLRDSGTDVGLVIANLLTTATVTRSRTGALEHLLVAFPMITATAPGANPDGTGHLGLVLTFNDPFSCTRGYEGTHQRPASDTAEVAPNQNAYCAEPPGSPIGVRGSQNAPYNGKPPAPAAPASTSPRLPGILSDLLSPN